MPKFALYAKVVASKYLGEVEAATKEEAIEMGYELDACHVSVCHQCANDVEDPEIDDITAEEVELMIPATFQEDNQPSTH